jgi:hypothetical protein
MLDYNCFIKKEELNLIDFQRLEELENATNRYVSTLSPNKIFNEIFQLNIPVDNFNSVELFVDEEINMVNYSFQNYEEILKGDDIKLILEIIKQQKVIPKFTKNSSSNISSQIQTLDLMADLLTRKDIEIKQRNLFINNCNEVLNAFITLLLNDVIDTEAFIREKILSSLNTLLDKDNEELSLGVLMCVGLIIYKTLFLDKSNSASDQLKTLCARLQNIFRARYRILSAFLHDYAYIRNINESDDYSRLKQFIIVFQNNDVNIQFLEYFVILLNSGVTNQIILWNLIDILTHSDNPAVMRYSSNIIINTMRTNNQLRDLFFIPCYKKLFNTLKILPDNNLLLRFLSAFNDNFGEDENFLAIYGGIFDHYDFIYDIVETQDPFIFLSHIKTIKHYLDKVSRSRVWESKFFEKYGLLGRFELFANLYTDEERKEIEIVLILLNLKNY